MIFGCYHIIKIFGDWDLFLDFFELKASGAFLRSLTIYGLIIHSRRTEDFPGLDGEESNKK